MTLATSAPEPCLELEDVAAFLDGRLSGAARAAVLSHVAACERCYEIFSETGRALLEERGTQAQRRAVAWGWPLLAAAGIVLAVAAGFLMLRRPATIDVAGLVDALPVRDAAQQFRSAPALRGGPAATRAAAMEIGALLVDLRVAALAADETHGRDVLQQLAARLQAAGHMDDEAQRCREAAAAFDAGRWKELASLLEERAAERYPPPGLDVGKLLEAGRLAAASAAPAFFSPARRALLERLRAHADPELAARLGAVLAAWDAPDRPLPALQRAFTAALNTASP